MRAKQIQDNDRISFEMRVLIECIYIGGTYDQLNLSGLACIMQRGEGPIHRPILVLVLLALQGNLPPFLEPLALGVIVHTQRAGILGVIFCGIVRACHSLHTQLTLQIS